MVLLANPGKRLRVGCKAVKRRFLKLFRRGKYTARKFETTTIPVAEAETGESLELVNVTRLLCVACDESELSYVRLATRGTSYESYLKIGKLKLRPGSYT